MNLEAQWIGEPPPSNTSQVRQGQKKRGDIRKKTSNSRRRPPRRKPKES